MEMQNKIKHLLVYSTGFLLSMSLLSNDVFAATVSGKDSAIKVTKQVLENSSEGDNNQTQTSDTTSSENENQIIDNSAKISSDAELFTPESLQPTKLKLPSDDHTYYVTKTSNEDYFEIQIGENTYWIKSENLIASTENPSELTQKRNLAITTKSKFNIYSQRDNHSKILVEGTKDTVFKVIDVVQDYYVVSVAGVKGYIPFSDINIEYQKNSNVEVATNSVKMYEINGGKYKAKGTLVNGAVVKVAKSTTNYHIIQVGRQTFAIPKKGTIPTEKPVSLGSLIESTYPIKLTVSKTNSIYTSKGNKMGTIDKGQVVTLKGLKGSKGIINYMGKSGYVNLEYFNHSNMVDPTKNITYGMYNYYLRVIAQLYPEFTEVEKIGESVQGRSIYALRVGNGKKEILMDAAIHGREHMTTNVLMEMIDQYTVSYRKGTNYAGYNVKRVLDKTSIWFVPMMNPDGVTLVQKGINSMDSKYRANLKKYNHGSNNFNRWKANGRGVDLNRNFDGLWKYVAYTPKSYMNYKGTSAFSEPEAQALKSFVQRHHFKTDLSYHSSGQIVYWFNFQKGSNRTRDLKLAKSVGKITGYTVVPPLYYRGSGSSADWFILNQKKPGLTIEIAPYAGNGPVPHRYWSSVWNKNKSIGLFGANEACRR
ncbi:M14 family zinc carboxypeptidase [Rummeliibacillus pycnus]|uniref:M14 family zinc carboxypeptidase n=1 Tax=Rummeliibacillus pycnus TaxID=101070 RepID=UPI003D27E45E